MLHDFLLQNQEEILGLTEKKTLDLAGKRPTSDQLKKGLPIFFSQLLGILSLQRSANTNSKAGIETAGTASKTESVSNAAKDATPAATGSHEDPGSKQSKISEHPEEDELAKSAGLHGKELLRLGYTLSDVVHAYGAMCQSITELAVRKKFSISAREFHDLNQCLDVAIAGAVTEFQAQRDTQEETREISQLGSLAHEMRNSLTSASIAFQMVKRGTVGSGGNTAQLVEKSLKRLNDLIDRSLTEVRLRINPTLLIESNNLLQIIDQILITAETEAQARGQKIEVKIDPTLELKADQQAFYSALSNLIQNALKYTHPGGTIRVQAKILGEEIEIEVEDECGGLLTHKIEELFQPFVQKNVNKSGLGLGLTIAQNAIRLNHGRIEARNLPEKGCIFKIILPTNSDQNKLQAPSAA